MANPATPTVPAPESKPARRFRWRWLFDLCLCLALAVCALGGPRWIEGRAALDWTRYYAGPRAASQPQGRRARLAAEQASRAIERLAPLPGAAEAAGLALGLCRELQPGQPELAGELFTQVAEAIASLRPPRRLGLGALEAEARRRAAQCKARAAGGEGAG